MDGDEPILYDFVHTIRPQLHNRGDGIIADIIKKGKSKEGGIPKSVQSIIASIKEEVN